MTTSQMLPSISLPTKINVHHDTLIDNIFTNHYNPDMCSGNFTVQLSDHLASFLISPNENQQYLPKKHNITKRDTKNFNKDAFLAEIKGINWDDILEYDLADTNNSFNSFYDTIDMTDICQKEKSLKNNSNRDSNLGLLVECSNQ
jgi:hypothetical protein